MEPIGSCHLGEVQNFSLHVFSMSFGGWKPCYLLFVAMSELGMMENVALYCSVFTQCSRKSYRE